MASGKRLIDADRAELYDAIGRNAFRDRQDIIDLINNQPTVDAVEVVRCEFCKNAEPYDCTIDGTIHRLYECKKDKAAIGYNKVVAKNDFCSCGKRREDGTD